MLDTIILKIPKNSYWITDYKKFGTTKEAMQNFSAGFACYKNNPTKADKASGIYKPCLTIFRRGIEFDLQIQFSAPKLLFNNNLDELEQSDFDKVVKTLKERLTDMGVNVLTQNIENANITSFHPSKNIPLSKGYTASFTIRELAKINLNQKLDLERVSFRNNGEALQFYANRHSLVLYDKINDLNKPTKRAIDKNQTKQQSSLFDFMPIKKQIEILRFEIRLSHRTKMKEVLKKIGYTENPIFKDIFKKNICQKILKLYWDNFFAKDLFLFSINNNPQKILQLILQKYQKTKPKTAVFLVGLMTLCKDDEGIRGLRTIINSKSWTPLRNYLNKFEDNIFKQPQHGFIKDIEKNLNEFNTFRLEKETRSYPLAL